MAVTKFWRNQPVFLGTFHEPSSKFWIETQSIHKHFFSFCETSHSLSSILTLTVLFRKRVVSSFFLYSGQLNAAPGYPEVHNEIDVEFIYKSSTSSMGVQFNYYNNGQGGNEFLHTPSFEIDQSYNWYGFKWTSSGIAWYVNGVQVHEVNDSTTPIIDSNGGPLRLMMNIWTIDPDNSGAVIWAGAYTHMADNTPQAFYDTVCHTDGETCGMPCSTATATATGDPHFLGFDGSKYDFHGEHGKNYVVYGQQRGDLLVAKTRATGELFHGMNKTYFAEFGLQAIVNNHTKKIGIQLKEKSKKRIVLQPVINGRPVQSDTKLHGGGLEIKLENDLRIKVITGNHMFSFRAVSVLSSYRRHIDFKVAMRRTPRPLIDRYTGVLGRTLSKKLGHKVHTAKKWSKRDISFEMIMRKLYEVPSLFPSQFYFGQLYGS